MAARAGETEGVTEIQISEIEGRGEALSEEGVEVGESRVEARRLGAPEEEEKEEGPEELEGERGRSEGESEGERGRSESRRLGQGAGEGLEESRRWREDS